MVWAAPFSTFSNTSSHILGRHKILGPPPRPQRLPSALVAFNTQFVVSEPSTQFLSYLGIFGGNEFWPSLSLRVGNGHKIWVAALIKNNVVPVILKTMSSSASAYFGVCSSCCYEFWGIVMHEILQNNYTYSRKCHCSNFLFHSIRRGTFEMMGVCPSVPPCIRPSVHMVLWTYPSVPQTWLV